LLLLPGWPALCRVTFANNWYLARRRGVVECLGVVFEKLIQTLIGQRMIEKSVQNLEGHGPDMGAGFRRIDHMVGMPQRCRQNLGTEGVVFVNLGDIADQFHAIPAGIVDASDKRTDEIRSGFRGENRLTGGEAQGDVYSDSFAAENGA